MLQKTKTLDENANALLGKKSATTPTHHFTVSNLLAEIYWSGGKDIWAIEPACNNRESVWRFPLEHAGKARRNIWLLSFLIVQEAMRDHAWTIYSTHRNQPPGNGVIVMKSNIIVKCHFFFIVCCLFKGSGSFLAWLGVSRAQGGESERKPSHSSSRDTHLSEPRAKRDDL